MTTPSMSEAAKIRDVSARHSYVFDNQLSSADFFDVKKRMRSEEFSLLLKHCEPTHRIIEAGCFTGLNLLGLADLGYTALYGFDFVAGALAWLCDQSARRGNRAAITCGLADFPRQRHYWMLEFDRVICFDVLEHQLNVGEFLIGISKLLNHDGRALFLVPVGREFYDCGHVAFFPDAECLRNVLDYVFDVDEVFELKSCRKLFAACRWRG